MYTDETTEFELGKAYQMRDGKDAVIFANGVMVSKAMEAAEILEKEGISVKIVNVSTVKPLKKEEVLKYIEGVKGIVTAEEHNIIGGLGSTIVELLKDENHPPLKFIGVKDRFGTSASSYEELLEYFGLTSESIVLAIKNLLNRH